MSVAKCGPADGLTSTTTTASPALSEDDGSGDESEEVASLS